MSRTAKKYRWQDLDEMRRVRTQPQHLNLDDFVSTSSAEESDSDGALNTSGSQAISDYFRENVKPQILSHDLDRYTSSFSEDLDKFDFSISPDRRPRAVKMLQEISPILPEAEEDLLEEPLPPRMQLQNDLWHPLKTSTMVNMQMPVLPKTNPRHVCSTPRSQCAPMGTSVQIAPGPSSVLGTRSRRQHQYHLQPVHKPHRPLVPDQYGLPGPVAKRYGSQGLVYLTIGVSGSNSIVVFIRSAIFFFDPHRLNSFIRVEIKPKASAVRKRKKHSRNFQYFNTKVVERSTTPRFGVEYEFRDLRNHLDADDVLSINAYKKDDRECELLGCMAFPLRKLFDKAYDQLHFKRKHESNLPTEIIKVAGGGYFLLNREFGSSRHLAENKIQRKKFYDNLSSSNSTCSSALSYSPIKMMGETEWRTTTPAGSTGGSSLHQQRYYHHHHLHRHRPEQAAFSSSLPPPEGGLRASRVLHDDLVSSSASSCYAPTYAVPRKRSSLTGAMINGDGGDDLNVSSPSTSSSSGSSTMNAVNGAAMGRNLSSSGSSTGVLDYNRAAQKRFTLPSIMTTNEVIPEFTSRPIQHHIDFQYLYADEPSAVMPGLPSVSNQVPRRRPLGSLDSGAPSSHGDEDEDDDSDRDIDRVSYGNLAMREMRHDARKVGIRMTGYHPSVRRVASFNSPPTKAQLAKEQQQQQREHRRGFFGKTLDYLRNKMDGTMSQSTLYPTPEEIHSWQDKMENLLESKFGCMLFGEFLEKEVCRENLDFSLKCREYKRLFRNQKKNVKKIARLAKDINDNFLSDNAPQEVNLEASVRTATRAAMSELKEDTFSLAQAKIEQLIANDKYPRFIKSPGYLELLKTVSNGSQISIQSAHPELPFTDSDGTPTPTMPSNEETPLAPQNRPLRSASALENGAF